MKQQTPRGKDGVTDERVEISLLKIKSHQL
jgi:hypothetical protein